MSNPVSIPILKANDRDYFEALRTLAATPIARELGFSRLTMASAIGSEFSLDALDQEVTQAELHRILETNGRVLRALRLTGGSEQPSVAINRTDDFQQGEPRGLHDKLTIHVGQNVNSDQQAKFACLLADAQRVVKSFSIDSLGPLLGEAATTHLAAREEALTRLETLHSSLLHDFEAQRRRLQEVLDEKESELKARFQQNSAALQEEHKQRLAALEKREEELATHKRALDDRSSTHVRREIREKLKEILTDRQKSFALSKDTQTRRRFVFWLYVVLLAVFATPASIFLYRELESTTWNPWTFGRQVAFSIGFVVTAGFFLRWLNRWAQQHADEEFKLKELEIDIDRASWVVEMALEWRAEKGEDIPAHLVERLSANLFGAKSVVSDDVPMTGADALASILLNTAARAKLTLPGGEVEIDKRALRSLSKKESHDE